jgi:hypothetical protein
MVLSRSGQLKSISLSPVLLAQGTPKYFPSTGQGLRDRRRYLGLMPLAKRAMFPNLTVELRDPSSPSIVPAGTEREMYIYWRISVRLASSGTLQSASARMAKRHGRFLTDPRDCHFDPKVLRCTGGNAYLTADEVTTMQKYYDVLALRPCAAGAPFGTTLPGA